MPGVRRQVVESAERVERARHGAFGRLGLADVRGDRDHALLPLARRSRGDLLERVGILRGGDDAQVGPFARQGLAIARPMPDEAPVTIAARPAKASPSQLFLAEVGVERAVTSRIGSSHIVEVASDPATARPRRDPPDGQTPRIGA